MYLLDNYQTNVHVHMYKYRLLNNVFEDKKTRIDLILNLLLCLDNLRMKKHMNHGIHG